MSYDDLTNIALERGRITLAFGLDQEGEPIFTTHITGDRDLCKLLGLLEAAKEEVKEYCGGDWYKVKTWLTDREMAGTERQVLREGWDE